VGCHNATEKIKNGQVVTVDTTSGDDGLIYDGEVEFEATEADVGDIERVETKITMNLANPEQAYSLQFIPNDGVGLVRMEFIVSNHIRAHPMALLHPEKLQQHEQEELKKLIMPYANGKDYFVRTLAQGVGTICAAFYPKRVILRFSDFKTNEYAGLLGGKHFEPDEENPMLGWRGASRYYDPDYRDGFALECEGVKMVRDEFGLTNLDVMIPFCRTITEAKKVIKEMEKNNLKREDQGDDRMRVMCMCEIPSNVILAKEFLEIFDGYSIGSNDLTQLCLGVDRDSAIVSKVFDERDEAVKRLIKQTIEICNQMGKYVGICGQAPSDYPEFADFLVECGIQSMSLNPDSIVETLLHLSGKDKKKQNEDEAKHKDEPQKNQAKSKQEGEDLHKAKGDASLAAH
jgi:pyruvate,water dikinase